jgi:hypothetical protein
MFALVHLDLGNTSGPARINPIVQFSPCTGQLSFRRTSDYFSCLPKKRLHCHAQMCFKHNASCTPTVRNTRACYYGSMGPRRLVHHDQCICSIVGKRPFWKMLNGCSAFNWGIKCSFIEDLHSF